MELRAAVELLHPFVMLASLFISLQVFPFSLASCSTVHSRSKVLFPFRTKCRGGENIRLVSFYCCFVITYFKKCKWLAHSFRGLYLVSSITLVPTCLGDPTRNRSSRRNRSLSHRNYRILCRRRGNNPSRWNVIIVSGVMRVPGTYPCRSAETCSINCSEEVWGWAFFQDASPKDL